MDGKVKNIKINGKEVKFAAPNGKQYLALKEGIFCSIFERKGDDVWKYFTSIKIEDKVTAQKIWEKIQI